jgi:hypothetical protein
MVQEAECEYLAIISGIKKVMIPEGHLLGYDWMEKERNFRQLCWGRKTQGKKVSPVRLNQRHTPTTEQSYKTGYIYRYNNCTGLIRVDHFGFPWNLKSCSDDTLRSSQGMYKS